ncbi:MAG: hypothetical protein RL648_789 [Verrucomicrobiota bacterium]
MSLLNEIRGLEPEACWVASISVSSVNGQLPEGLLSPAEQAALGRFSREADRMRHALGRALARVLLGGRCNELPSQVPLTVDAHGKPVVEGGTVSFSIAHGADAVVVACAPVGAVGIDVEAVDRPVQALRLARHFFHAEEVGFIEGGEERMEARFLKIWTAKEAYLKAIGLGLRLPLRSFAIAVDSSARGRVVGGPEGPREIRWCHPVAGHLAALCAELMEPAIHLQLEVKGGWRGELRIRTVGPISQDERWPDAF